MLEDDDVEDESGDDGSEGEDGGEGDDEDGGGEGDEDDFGGDGEEGEDGGDEDEDEEAGDEVPDPATYIVCYMIKADGQPETDHTDPNSVKGLDPKGKLKLPGNFNVGIEFQSGGATVDTLDLKKLGKELKGKVDADEVSGQIKTIFKANFPEINIPDVDVRDNKSLGVELNKKTKASGDAQAEINPEDYNGKLKAALANSEYSLWIEVSDYREKPFVDSAGVADVINTAVKKVGGYVAKKLSGVKADDVFLLRGTAKMSKDETLQDKAKRKIPNPSEIKAIIDKYSGKSSAIWARIDAKFDTCIEANYKASDAIAKSAISKWDAFKKANKNKEDTLEYKVYLDFYEDYLKFYNKTVQPQLAEAFLTEQGLM